MEKTKIKTLVNKHLSYTTMINELIKSLLKSYNIKYHIVEQRTKTTDSLEEKIKRKKIKNIDEEITDISGIRVILYYQDDVDKVDSLIKENFEIDIPNSIDKAKLYDSNQFGYLSIHYIVQLDSTRKKLPEWKGFSNLKAEIQVRTVLQHSWASISHELSYKKAYEIPKELERKLFRLAGLFELADEQFLKIRDEHQTLSSSLEKLSEKDTLKLEEINTLTLKYSLNKKNSIYKEIERMSYSIGFLNSDNAADNFEDENDEKKDFYPEIIIVSKILGYKYINELESKLIEDKDQIEIILKMIESDVKDWHITLSFITLLASLTFLDLNQLDNFSKKSGWENNLFDIVVNAIKKVKKL